MPGTPFFIYQKEIDYEETIYNIGGGEIRREQGEEGRRSVKFLTEANGCINGCCSGVTICSETEFNPEPGFHDDQEGFFVLEGNGFVRLDNEEFEVKAGDSFIALSGVRHTMKTVDSEKPLKVFWFHSGI